MLDVKKLQPTIAAAQSNLDELEDFFPTNLLKLGAGTDASASGGAAQFIGRSALWVGKKEAIPGAVTQFLTVREAEIVASVLELRTSELANKTNRKTEEDNLELVAISCREL